MSSFLFISRIAESELRGRNLLNIWCSSVIDILAYFWAMLVNLSEILMHAQQEIEHSIAVIELLKPLVENTHVFFFYLFLRFSFSKVGSQTVSQIWDQQLWRHVIALCATFFQFINFGLLAYELFTKWLIDIWNVK